MTNELTKPEASIMALSYDEHGADWAIGDQLIAQYGDIWTIIKIYEKDGAPVIVAQSTERTYQDGTPVQQSYKLAEWKYYHYLKIPGTVESLREDALKALADPAFMDTLDLYGGKAAQSTALATKGTPDQIKAVRDQAAILRNRAEVMQRMIGQMMAPIREMAKRMQARVGHLENMLDVLSAYVGLYEHVEQIQDGEPASPETPIALRQLVLFMDEEAGITDWIEGREGISWTSVDAFDKWLIADPKHLAQVAPEARCVVALKPSRQRRETGDWWRDMAESKENNRTYLLIRNGDKLYRVWTGFSFGEILYPKQGEYADIIAKVAKEKEEKVDNYQWQGVELGWKRNIAMLQGIIERTDVFQPMASAVNLFDPDTLEGTLLLIRDSEMLLTDGRPRFREWQRSINANIKRGDRIFVAPLRWRKDDWKERFLRSYNNPPNPPPSGVYNVDRVEVKNNYWSSGTHTDIVIIYMPSNDVWTWDNGSQERKRGEGFVFHPDDECILRYDDIDVATLEYYLNSRLDRPAYLDILPVLRGLLRKRRAEQAEEEAFARLIARELDCPASEIFAAIEWWKTKVIMKRPLTQDDAKAWRMIKRRQANPALA